MRQNKPRSTGARGIAPSYDLQSIRRLRLRRERKKGEKRPVGKHGHRIIIDPERAVPRTNGSENEVRITRGDQLSRCRIHDANGDRPRHEWNGRNPGARGIDRHRRRPCNGALSDPRSLRGAAEWATCDSDGDEKIDGSCSHMTNRILLPPGPRESTGPVASYVTSWQFRLSQLSAHTRLRRRPPLPDPT